MPGKHALESFYELINFSAITSKIFANKLQFEVDAFLEQEIQTHGGPINFAPQKGFSIELGYFNTISLVFEIDKIFYTLIINWDAGANGRYYSYTKSQQVEIIQIKFAISQLP